MTNSPLSHYINNIIIKDFKDNGFINKSSTSKSLSNLSPLNFFIGTNNSGKSRLIRYIYNSKDVSIGSDNLNIRSYVNEIRENISSLHDNEYQHPDPFYETTLNDEALYLANSINDLYDRNENSEINNEINEFLSQPGISQDLAERLYNEIYGNLENKVEYKFLNLHEDNFNKCYIPILRGLRPLNKSDSDENDLKLVRTVEDYNLVCSQYKKDEIKVSNSGKSNCKKYTIFTGYSIYSDLIELLMGGHNSRSKLEFYEKYLSNNFFNHEKITLSPIKGRDVVSIKIGDADERPIYDLGDGLQTIIIITFPVFTASEPTQFFIEEPETHLHAGFQRTLIEALASQKEHQFFISTHSNHFVDLAQERNDVSIQRVFQEKQSDGKFKTCVDSLAKDTELLDDLGVRASSVLLANSSIWVEGVTDKLYLRAYMKKYIDELKATHKEEADNLYSFKENLHYIFTEYQGSNITHWYFGDNENINDEATSAPKLCAKAFLLADGDIQSKGKRVQELKDALGDSFMLLDFKEIENYIPESILKKASEELWNTFKLKVDATFNQEAIKQSDYGSDKGIGCYLEGFVNNHPTERRFFKDKSGTIKDKIKLCRIAVRLMNESEDWELTPEITKVCERIYDHILRSNHG